MILAAALARDVLVGGAIPEAFVPLLFVVGYLLGIFWVGSP